MKNEYQEQLAKMRDRVSKNYTGEGGEFNRVKRIILEMCNPDEDIPGVPTKDFFSVLYDFCDKKGYRKPGRVYVGMVLGRVFDIHIKKARIDRKDTTVYVKGERQRSTPLELATERVKNCFSAFEVKVKSDDELCNKYAEFCKENGYSIQSKNVILDAIDTVFGRRDEREKDFVNFPGQKRITTFQEILEKEMRGKNGNR